MLSHWYYLRVKTMTIKIITDINILKSPNKEVEMQEAVEIISKLEIALKESPIPGVGLAAPQIGINKRVAIIRTEDKVLNLINPIITEKHKGFVNFDERCLSFPNISVNTKRHKEIFVKDDLCPEGFVVTGFEAVVIAHETDHLDGIVITDRTVGKNKIGRNDPCPCGKPVKYKNCHGKN